MDCSSRILSGLRRGRNPRNRNVSPENPDNARAAVTAEGPGTTSTLKPDWAAAATNSLPGSLIPGIPASVTKATSPWANSANTPSSLSRQLCW